MHLKMGKKENSHFIPIKYHDQLLTKNGEFYKFSIFTILLCSVSANLYLKLKYNKFYKNFLKKVTRF